MKIRRRRNVFSPSKKFSPAGRRRSLPFLLSFFLPFLPPVSPRPPSSHHPHQTKNASRPRERAQSRGRHPLPRVRLPDPLQEADEASRAVRGEVEAERKKKVDATRKRGDTNRESRASAEFCFPLVLSTTTGPLPALIPPRAEREIGSPACLVNVVKMTERKRKKKTWRGRKEEREDQDEDQTHFSLALWAFSALRSLSVLRSSLSPILHRSPAPHIHRQPMSDVPRHRGSCGSEQKSSHDDDGTGAMIPPSTSSPPPHHHQTSSIPLPTALSNALDLRPGAWPEGHPMSRARSDGDLKEITWLTAKVRRKKNSFLVSRFFDRAIGRPGEASPETKRKTFNPTGRPPRAPSRGPHRRLALVGTDRGRGRDVPDPLFRRAELRRGRRNEKQHNYSRCCCCCFFFSPFCFDAASAAALPGLPPPLLPLPDPADARRDGEAADGRASGQRRRRRRGSGGEWGISREAAAAAAAVSARAAESCFNVVGLAADALRARAHVSHSSRAPPAGHAHGRR